MSTLYEVNTRVLGPLDDIADALLDHWAALGFDWIWLLGVWRTGAAGRAVARADPGLRRAYAAALPDLREADICGSCFAITAYRVADRLGGEAALRRFRRRLADRGCRLMLDFVPNHMALDHPWTQARPELFVHGTAADLIRAPANFARIATAHGEAVLAHGRDPNFPGWSDTVQLDYGEPATQRAMREELLAVAELCDGVRCDMAMLLLPEVFERTWGITPAPFWPEAIARVRARHPGFLFLAEGYWDLEWTLQQQGFDCAYDKRLYDRLVGGDADGVRAHLAAGLDFQRGLARFLENHDEPRAASAFAWDHHQAAAVVALLAPGLKLLHQGQLEGARTRLPVQLCRAPREPTDAAIADFYATLLALLRRPELTVGAWRLLALREAWSGNASWQGFVAFAWAGAAGTLIVAVNFAPHAGQCFVELPYPHLAGGAFVLADMLGPARYRRQGDELLARGLYLDLPAWGRHAFRLLPAGAAEAVAIR
jgi:glycosidase